MIEAAAANGEDKILGLLDEWYGIGPDKERWLKISLFVNAAVYGKIATINELIDSDVSLDTPTIHGVTPLWTAC